MYCTKQNYVKLILIVIFFSLKICIGYDNSIYDSYYDAVKNIAELYTRPITILETTITNEEHAFHIARHYKATYVVVEEKAHKRNRMLANFSKGKNVNNIILLSKKITVNDLERLASCEHFDLVLIFNLHNRWQKECERTIKAISNLGDNIIVGVSPNSSCWSKFKNHLINYNSDIIWKMPHNEIILFWLKNKNKSLDRHHWLGKSGFSSDYIITSNFYEKSIYKIKEKLKNNWIPGINLLTFVMLNGKWPNKKIVQKNIKKLSNIEHEDFMIWNIIIQGTNIIPIDFTIASKNPLNKELGLSFTLEMLKQNTGAEAVNWFKDNWPLFATKQERDIPLTFFDLDIS